MPGVPERQSRAGYACQLSNPTKATLNQGEGKIYTAHCRRLRDQGVDPKGWFADPPLEGVSKIRDKYDKTQIPNVI